MVGEGVPVGLADKHHVTDAQPDRRGNDRRHDPRGAFQDDVEPRALITAESQPPRPVQIGTSRDRPSGADGRHNFSHDVHGSYLLPNRDPPERTGLRAVVGRSDINLTVLVISSTRRGPYVEETHRW